MLEFLINSFIAALPSWLFPMSALAGLVFYFATGLVRSLPIIGAYARLLRPVGFVVFAVSTFLWGGAGVIAAQQAAVKAAEARLKAVEAEQKQINSELAAKLQAQTQAARARTIVVERNIQAQAKEVDRECSTINAAARELYNSSIRNEVKK